MKQDYTLDELQTEMTALAQLFDSVTRQYKITINAIRALQ